MKKYWIILLIATITYSISPTVKCAEETENVLESQTDSLGISTFLSDSEKYTKDTFENLDMGELFKDSVSGKIDNSTIANIIFALLGDNVETALKTISSVMIIFIIHSILKAISENLGNENVSKILKHQPR